MSTNAPPLRGELDLADLALPAWRPLVAVEVEDYVDTDGLDAVLVWLVVRDDIADEEFGDPATKLMHIKIHDYLRNHGERLFPYFRLTTVSDRHRPVYEYDDEGEDDVG
jgi:hypothetical protein